MPPRTLWKSGVGKFLFFKASRSFPDGFLWSVISTGYIAAARNTIEIADSHGRSNLQCYNIQLHDQKEDNVPLTKIEFTHGMNAIYLVINEMQLFIKYG